MMLILEETPVFVWVTVAIVISLYLFLRPRRGSTKDAPPVVLSSPVFPVPLIGMGLEFCSSPVKMITRCHEKYGSVFTIPIAHKRITLLVGPEAQETFFKAGDDSLSQNEVYDFMRPVFGKDVVYDATRKNRQVQFQNMANGLRTQRLKVYVEKIERETRLYLKENFVGEEGEIDLLHALSELTILTASRCLHGDDVREEMFKEVAELYHDLDSGLTPLTVFWPNAPIKVHRDRNAARDKMVQLFSKVIKRRREGKGKTDGTDILSIFMDIKYKDGTLINEEQVTGLLIALLFAGQHTSCITSTWTSLFIANQPNIVERIVKEQKLVFAKHDKKPMNGDTLDFDMVNEMGFMHDCMREALRLCPPLILLMRMAMKDVEVKTADKQTYTIPKGDIVGVAPSVGMRLPHIFPKPDDFDPDRYGPDREEHKQPYAYMGFGGGMHSCMGQNFAFVQVKTILSVLFREFSIERIEPGMPDIDYEAMVVGPKGDCRVRYKKRS
eukprot:CAMPEP_0194050604 /NCGR_PEP_ID=MMETSP0009_2-20130614/36193_1 /TAXON_ID=210454 /ORGANISM="Grammatophora oceanica, Strain CCMP 410" /LENGTH=496 /DNA_ID=CAMNT_0038697323 /DNA_START=35 /DNA_END=1525 /DNA_ORIENTATION=+